MKPQTPRDLVGAAVVFLGSAECSSAECASSSLKIALLGVLRTRADRLGVLGLWESGAAAATSRDTPKKNVAGPWISVLAACNSVNALIKLSRVAVFLDGKLAWKYILLPSLSSVQHKL